MEIGRRGRNSYQRWNREHAVSCEQGLSDQMSCRGESVGPPRAMGTRDTTLRNRVLIHPRREGTRTEEVTDQGQGATAERTGKLTATQRDKGITQNPQLSEGETPHAEIQKAA